MEKQTKKMQWFIDKYNNDELAYYWNKNNYNYGTIVMPTGTGKSSLVFEDILRRIDNIQERKIILNISCPILKLTQQFVSDLFEIMSAIYTGENKKNIKFFINSSDDGRNYKDSLIQMGIDCDNFKNINASFCNNSNYNIAIVASCHKSMYKFIQFTNNVKTHKNNTHYYGDIVSYIDESHLIRPTKKNNCIVEETESSFMVDINLENLCCNSTAAYAFSATPNAEVTDIIKQYDIYSERYIYQKNPTEAFSENIICKPKVSYIPSSMTSIDEKILSYIMKNVRRENPNIAHKILVTLTSAEEVKSLRKNLEGLGYKVFSTCAKYGFGTNDEDDYENVVSFINAVDTYENDCFVLHIRQLVQGIDIKSLTDCVILTKSHGSVQNYVHTIQIIGRVLRTLPGERGKDESERLKKHSNVFFITSDEDKTVEENISQFIIRYYGIGNVDFEIFGHRKNASVKEDDIWSDIPFITKKKEGFDYIQTLLINISNYIEKHLKPKYDALKYGGFKLNIEDEIKVMLDKYDTFKNDCDTVDLLSDKMLFKKISELLKKYHIEEKTLF